MAGKAAVVDVATIPEQRGVAVYPPYLSEKMKGRARRRLGDAVGLKNFGVNLIALEPGCWSAQRHWHTRQDELVYVLEGELTLHTNDGAQAVKPGMVVGFPANCGDGHRFENTGKTTAKYIEVGDRLPGDEVVYPDVDMAARQGMPAYAFTKKDGSAF
ncbi:MAG TPA: cupin domain-containing protein [Alphaproteobacteria bacterium]|jgi:uncharacterized cupin superfamily protein